MCLRYSLMLLSSKETSMRSDRMQTNLHDNAVNSKVRPTTYNYEKEKLN